MRVQRTIISIAVITLIALAYVHQQVELVKLSYAIDNKEKSMERLLDRKDNLGYNIKELESSSRLEKVLTAQKITVGFPKRANVVKVAGLPSKTQARARLRAAGIEKKASAFGILEFFGLSREAQAKEK